MTRHSFATCVFGFLVVAVSSCQWTGAPRSTPSFKYVQEKEGGCRDLFLFKETADGLEVLWISADKEKLKLSATGSNAFDLATAPDGLEVGVDLWEKAPTHSAYCNDIAPDTEKKATWKAKKGKLTITLSEPVDAARPGPKTFKASARLEGMVFQDRGGNQATLKEETITDAHVGWTPG